MSSNPQTRPTQFAESHQAGQSRSITIVDWPLKSKRLSSICIAVLAVVAGIFLGRQSGGTLFGVVATCLVLLVSWRNWIPVTFVIGPIGIEQQVLRFRRRIAWSHIKRCEVHRQGMLILPEQSTSPLAAFKGIYIECGDDTMAVAELAKTYMHRRVSTGSSIRARNPAT